MNEIDKIVEQVYEYGRSMERRKLTRAPIDEPFTLADANIQIGNILIEAKTDALKDLLSYDCFNKPYTWSEDERPYEVVRHHIAELERKVK